jgi:hypothetical protein
MEQMELMGKLMQEAEKQQRKKIEGWFELRFDKIDGKLSDIIHKVCRLENRILDLESETYGEEEEEEEENSN